MSELAQVLPAGDERLSHFYAILCAVALLCETDNDSTISIVDLFKCYAHGLGKPKNPR